MKNLIFDFSSTSGKDKAIKQAVAEFKKNGASVVDSTVDQNATRRAGVTFRYIHFTFADGQRVSFGIKNTGDVFEVKVNGKVRPIKNQDSHGDAIKEVAEFMDKGRSAFQKALARIKTVLPPSIRISRAKLHQLKVEKRDSLKAAIAQVEAQILELQAA